MSNSKANMGQINKACGTQAASLTCLLYCQLYRDHKTQTLPQYHYKAASSSLSLISNYSFLVFIMSCPPHVLNKFAWSIFWYQDYLFILGRPYISSLHLETIKKIVTVIIQQMFVCSGYCRVPPDLPLGPRHSFP